VNDTTDAPVESVGWIGAGRMGAAMAARLAKAGVKVTVWNRTRAKAEPLAGLGAEIVDSSTVDSEAYEAVRPYLSIIGRTVTYAGEGEVARLVKLCHNVFLGAAAGLSLVSEHAPVTDGLEEE
jgi:3-hydroxyisobutyrate dehydrogenase-like beta-hydroxyacid dehydrogenase